MRVLIVEQDPNLSKARELSLTYANLNCYATDIGDEALDLAKLYDYDLILLNPDLPDMSGVDLIRQIRHAKIETPIITIASHEDHEQKMKSFSSGADDYVTIDIEREELIARIHAIIRRSQGHAQSLIQTGPISINLDTKAVTAKDLPVHLTGKEYQMMELLSLRKGTTLTKEMFLNHLYGGMDEPELKIIDVFMCKLRKKLTEAGKSIGYDSEKGLGADVIQTVWNRGYTLQNPTSHDHRFNAAASSTQPHQPRSSQAVAPEFGEAANESTPQPHDGLALKTLA